MNKATKPATCANLDVIYPLVPQVVRRFYLLWWRLRQVVVSLRQDGGLVTLQKTMGKLRPAEDKPLPERSSSNVVEVLGLQPGELVEVKSEPEIRATLDGGGKTRGLYFMPEMWKFCGRRFRVHKRVSTIMVESTRQVRKVKNTVLLETVVCDGSAHEGCDGSCFHFWREAWLQRVDDSPTLN